MNVLLVEDNRAIRSLMVKLLERSFHSDVTVTECDSGESAVEMLSSGNVTPDVVLLDIDLPGMDGIEVCSHIRTNYGSSSEFRPYIMMVTSHDGSDHLAKAIGAGANDYITKPINTKILQVRMKVAEKMLEQAIFSEQSDFFKSMALYCWHYSCEPVLLCEWGSSSGKCPVAYVNKSFEIAFEMESSSIQGVELEAVLRLNKTFAENVFGQLAAGTHFRGRAVYNSESDVRNDVLDVDMINSSEGRPSYLAVRIQSSE